MSTARKKLIFRPSTSSGRPRTSASRLGTAAARPAPPKIKKKRVGETERKPDIVSFSLNETKKTCNYPISG